MHTSKENKIIARETLNVFGGKPIVKKYWDDNNISSVDILCCEDVPQIGISSYATLGLSDCSIGLNVNSTPLRVEFVSACASNCIIFPNILATCAFCVINDSHKCIPGTIFHDVISMYEKSGSMHHMLAVCPFLWGEKLSSLRLTTKTVTWLMLIPISESECLYAEDMGADKLEAMFEKHNIDIFNPNRSPVI